MSEEQLATLAGTQVAVLATGAIMNAGGRMVAAKLVEEWLGQHETK